VLVTIAFSVFALVVLALFAAGLAMVARQLRFMGQSYRVQGRVINEWEYRLYGHRRRYYRVEFQLRNGQRAELRGSGLRPAVGSALGVLVREAAGRDPKAQIDTWFELWFMPVVSLGLGLMGLFMLNVMLQANPL
jgi:hypothetical protein